jgi:Cof subfamily protein (haloacid dehalogenase superfamily)
LYKLIALDLDDTLLGKDATIGAPEKAAVAAARARGIEVTLVTARSWRATRPFAEELGLTMPVICMTGSTVYSVKGEPLYQTTIALEEARRLAAQGDAERWAYRLYYPDGRIFASWPAEDYNPNAPATLYPIKEYTGALLPLLENGEPPIQVACLGNRSVEAVLAALVDVPDLVATTYDRYSAVSRTHIMHRKVTKGGALAEYCERHGIPREAVIAMGDGEPDRSMIEWAGTGVAMGWAPEHVRAAADFVTAADDEHPVATALTRLLGL